MAHVYFATEFRIAETPSYRSRSICDSVDYVIAFASCKCGCKSTIGGHLRRLLFVWLFYFSSITNEEHVSRCHLGVTSGGFLLSYCIRSRNIGRPPALTK